MARFSKILMTADYDRTLTDTEGNIPEKNTEAINEFIALGGLFTINTGRSTALFKKYMYSVPVNAPMIMYNGAAIYSRDRNEIVECAPVADGRELAGKLWKGFPGLWMEIQGRDRHYVFDENPMRDRFMNKQGAAFELTEIAKVPEPIIKISFSGDFHDDSGAQFFSAAKEELEYLDSCEEELRIICGDSLRVERPAPRIIDIQNKNADKGSTARRLAEELGREILVCAGDAQNDLSMLNEADYAFIPADASEKIKGRGFKETLSCGEGCIYGAVQELKKLFK